MIDEEAKKIDIEENKQMFKDITEDEKAHLIEEEYLDPLVLKYATIWAIRNPDFCKLVSMTWWGNDEAEHWFWKEV